MLDVYGIKNCSTVKKALDWLDNHDVDYTFHDYKKSGVDEAVLRQAIALHGWENVINRKGMTWRNLSADVKETMDKTNAITVALENPSIIKRPMLVKRDTILLGFDPEQFSKFTA